jgi:hypothetical protein
MSYGIEFEYNSEEIRTRFGMIVLVSYFLMNIVDIVDREVGGEGDHGRTKHFVLLGDEHFLLVGGVCFSTGALLYSKIKDLLIQIQIRFKLKFDSNSAQACFIL